MLPKGEHKTASTCACIRSARCPSLDDDGFVLYETRAINAYLDATLIGPAPRCRAEPRERARMDQWISVADAYFIPYAHPMIVELLFRRYLGGEQNTAAIAAGARRAWARRSTRSIARSARRRTSPATAFTLADIHWMPYVDYLHAHRRGRADRAARRACARGGARRRATGVAERGAHRPAAVRPGATADAIEQQYR